MEINSDVATMYGILAGDGCLSRTVNNKLFISITCNFHDDKPFFDKIVIPLMTRIREKETKYRSREALGKIEINFMDTQFFNFFENLGFPVGKKSTKLFIPSCLGDFTKDIILGYFATDGSLVLTDNNGILYPRLEIQSLSQKILKQVLEFLHSFGVTGNVYKIQYKDYKPIYRLQCNGLGNLILFEKNIGFLNPKHRVKFTNYINSRSSAVVARHTHIS